MAQLRLLELFQKWKFPELVKLSYTMSEESFRLGEYVYQEGAPAQNLIFIFSGEVSRRFDSLLLDLMRT